jgi:hypothetical protein
MTPHLGLPRSARPVRPTWGRMEVPFVSRSAFNPQIIRLGAPIRTRSGCSSTTC